MTNIITPPSSTPALSLDWAQIQRFSPTEWPAGVLEHMDARVIQALVRIRNTLPRDASFIPSPVPEAHVRHRARSPGTLNGDRHSTDLGRRLVDATDFFVDWRWAWAAWEAILADPEVGGAGIYTDMIFGGTPRGRCMFHIDCRPNRVMWVGWRDAPVAGVPLKYTFWHSEPRHFMQLLVNRGIFRGAAA